MWVAIRMMKTSLGGTRLQMAYMSLGDEEVRPLMGQVPE